MLPVVPPLGVNLHLCYIQSPKLPLPVLSMNELNTAVIAVRNSRVGLNIISLLEDGIPFDLLSLNKAEIFLHSDTCLYNNPCRFSTSGYTISSSSIDGGECLQVLLNFVDSIHWFTSKWTMSHSQLLHLVFRPVHVNLHHSVPVSTMFGERSLTPTPYHNVIIVTHHNFSCRCILQALTYPY